MLEETDRLHNQPADVDGPTSVLATDVVPLADAPATNPALMAQSDSPATITNPSSSTATLSRQVSSSSSASSSTAVSAAPAPPRKVGMMEVRNGRYAADFEQMREVGAGGFGKVYLARSRLDAREYAVKLVRLSSGTERRLRKMLREMQVLADLNHVNVVRYYQAWLEDEVDGADAMGVLDEEAEEAFTDTKLSNSAKGMGSANSAVALRSYGSAGGARADSRHDDFAAGDGFGAGNSGAVCAIADDVFRRPTNVSFAGDLSMPPKCSGGEANGPSSSDGVSANDSGDDGSAVEDDDFDDIDRTIGGDMTFGDTSRSWGGFAFQSSSGVPEHTSNGGEEGECGAMAGADGGADGDSGMKIDAAASAQCSHAMPSSTPQPQSALLCEGNKLAQPRSHCQISFVGDGADQNEKDDVDGDNMARPRLTATAEEGQLSGSGPGSTALRLDMGAINASPKVTAPKTKYDLMLYIQMEFCSQRTLREHLDPPSVLADAAGAPEVIVERDLDETLFFMTQISSALDYIHSRKLIHRDLKPGNIFKVTAAFDACLCFPESVAHCCICLLTCHAGRRQRLETWRLWSGACRGNRRSGCRSVLAFTGGASPRAVALGR